MTQLSALAATRRLRLAAAAIWIATAVLVVAPSYRAIGGDYLARAGLPIWLMYVACTGELVLGILVALRPPTWWDTLGQLAAIAFFTAVLAAVEPMLLVSPFGVLAKNLPLAAVVAAAYLLRRGEVQRAWWMLRAGVAIIWITEGLMPKLLFQQEVELEIARRSVLVWFDASLFVALLGAAQLISGLLVLVLPPRPLRILLALQAFGLVFFPAVVAHQQPEMLLHPFTPLLKNIPILVATWLLMTRSSPPCPTPTSW